MKVKAGQPFRPSARDWNTFVDTARSLQTGKLNVDFDGELPEHSRTKILVKNQSGDKLDRFSILALGEPWRRPEDDLPQFKRQIVFRGEIPQQHECKDPKHPFVVLLEPLQPGEIGEGVLAGIVIAQVDVIRETDLYAEVVDGNTTSLRTSPHGRSRILWKEPGLGLKWSVVRLSDRPRFAIFELPSNAWKTGDGGADPPEPAGWAKMPQCKPVFYFSDEFTYRADEEVDERETIWHKVGYPARERNDVIALHTSTGLLPSKFGANDWVWCFWNEYECRWQVLAEYEDHWRFKLIEPLQRCGSALANLVLFDGTYCPVALTFTVTDSIGILKPDEPTSSAGPSVIPAGTYGVAKHFADSDNWEVLALGEGCCPKSSSSGSPYSAASSRSSLSSFSFQPSSFSRDPSSPSSPLSSDSSQPSSYPSSDESDLPSPTSSSNESPSSDPSSPQPSSERSSKRSKSPESESAPSELSSRQSDKSTAIVPASWSSAGYTALFIAEMPEVRFDDVMTAIVSEDETLVPIDPKFIEVCERGTLQVCGCVPDVPVPIGAVVKDDAVHVRTQSPIDNHKSTIQVTLRLTGIRKGFQSQRFPNRTEQQFLANEEFIRSAYPGATK
jgi:hypothetical protein